MRVPAGTLLLESGNTREGWCQAELQVILYMLIVSEFVKNPVSCWTFSCYPAKLPPSVFPSVLGAQCVAVRTDTCLPSRHKTGLLFVCLFLSLLSPVEKKEPE